MTDEAIMMKLAGGDLDMATLLFERYQGKIYNFFLHFLRDRDMSEDLTQNVFVRVLKYRTSYKSEQSFKAWIYQIARNIKTDHYRKNRQLHDKYTDLSNVEMPSDSVLENLEQTEQNEALQRALKRMPEDQRELLIMCKFQKMKYAEIAEVVESNEAAIKVRVHRAIKQLRKYYFAEEAK